MLIEVELLVRRYVLNLSKIFLFVLVPYFDLYLSAMLEFCMIYVHLKIKKEQKSCFKTFEKGCLLKHFNYWLQGLPPASDGAYDKRCLIRVIFYLHLKHP